MSALTMPNRVKLRTAYDDAILEIQSGVSSCDFSKGFYANMATSVFNHAWYALTDFCGAMDPKNNVPPRMHVIAAPAGGGKTTFSKAMLVALTQVAEGKPTGPYGCLFLADQIVKADQLYTEMNALLPGKVAIWTSDHDPRATSAIPADRRYHVDTLASYPVVIATHKFFNGPRREKITQALRGDKWVRRALIIVDEKPEDTVVYDATLSAAEKVREAIRDDSNSSLACREAIDSLCKFMQDRSFSGPDLETPKSGTKWSQAAGKLWWFNTKGAEEYLSKSTADESVKAVFGFARAITRNCAFINRQKGEGNARYIGYEMSVDVIPGMVLLDATSDIDGVTPLCPWREHGRVPQASYARLEIVHYAPHTKKRLSEYFKQVKNRQEYAKRMVEIIRENMSPEETGLVVCKKTLFENRNIPNWLGDDPRWDDSESYGRRTEWTIDGRRLYATHWGAGLGFNVWSEADVVFLFDEHIMPRRVVIATAQALQRKEATEGALAAMKTTLSKSPIVTPLSEGLILRWTKQMALRGKARVYDEHGRCSPQRLVMMCDAKRLAAHVERMFPSAKPPVIDTPQTGKVNHKVRLLEILSKQPAYTLKLTTRELGKLMGIQWRNTSGSLLRDQDLMAGIASLGWHYVQGRGRGGSSFVRVSDTTSFAAAA